MSKHHHQSEGMKALEQSLNDHMEICRLKRKTKRLKAENARLKAEVERLRKAGDAMQSAYYKSKFAGMIPPEEDPDTEEMEVRIDNAYKAVDEAMRNWNAAKEGKQP